MHLKNPDEQQFFLIEASKEKWSLRELDRQINSALYERLMLSKDKKGVMKLAKEGEIIETPQDIIRQPYILEFLGLEAHHKYTEKDLESAIINNLQYFLLEMGKGFSFVARQRRIKLDIDDFYIDLVFYNRLLQCRKSHHLTHFM
jgi:predicted nuclease of restriction endonuclease-like (RecB) superfamily